MSVTAPEGTSLAAMDEVMRVVETEMRSIPGVRLVLAKPAAVSWAASILAVLRPHRPAR